MQGLEREARAKDSKRIQTKLEDAYCLSVNIELGGQGLQKPASCSWSCNILISYGMLHHCILCGVNVSEYLEVLI